MPILRARTRARKMGHRHDDDTDDDDVPILGSKISLKIIHFLIFML